MSVYLTAVFTAKAGSSETLKTLLQDLVVQSTKEAACLQYELYQSAEDENIFVFHETWESQDGLDGHNGQPYIQNLIEKAPGLVAVPITLYKTTRLS
jgi:quinol monooxygenase YgiN